MIFDVQTAKKLEALVHPDVEKALLLLLDTVLEQEDAQISYNPACTDAQLRMFQGKKMLIKELKEYRNRLNDAIKRDKDGSHYTGPE